MKLKISLSNGYFDQTKLIIILGDAIKFIKSNSKIYNPFFKINLICKK